MGMKFIWTLGGIFHFLSRTVRSVYKASPWQDKSQASQNTVLWQSNQQELPDTHQKLQVPPPGPIELQHVRARSRSEHHKDNSAAQSPPRALETSGSPQGSIDTSLETTESTPLVPAIIHVPRRTSTSTVSRVLEPLLKSPIDSANDIWSTVMEQLQAFFARQGDFNKRLEEWLKEWPKEHLQGQGRENTQTVQATSFSKALSVSHLSSKIKFNFNYFSLVYRLFSLPAIKQFKS